MRDINFIELILGFLLGSFSSWLIWIINEKLISPKITVSENIIRQNVSYNKNKIYKVKIYNKSKWRDIIDVKVHFRVKFPFISNEKDVDKFGTVVEIPIGKHNGHIPRIKSKKSQIMNIYVEETDSFDDLIFPEDIRDKYKQKELNLDYILSLSKDVYGQFFVFGYDRFSGSRVLFESKKYYYYDIVDEL